MRVMNPRTERWTPHGPGVKLGTRTQCHHPRSTRPGRRVAPVPEPLHPPEETTWIVAAQRGDRAAYARVVDAYWERLYRWLFRMTHDRHKAEDLTQETFLKALAAIGSFRPGTNFRAWLFRIGHNNFVNLKRGEKRATQTLPDEPMQADGPPGPQTMASDRETLVLVSKAVAELPADFRSALLLRAEEGLSFREVAAVLGITEETARWRVFKARQKLVKVLAPELLPPMKGDEG